MPQLTSDFWIQAYIQRLRLADIPVFVVSKGDPTAGAVLIKVNTLDGKTIAYQRRFDMARDARIWIVLAEGDEAQVDQSLAKQQGFDPDIWVLEVEDRAGRHLLDQEGLSN